MIDFIAYISVRALNKIFMLLPVSACLWVGRRFGTLAFVFNKKRRLIAYANLKAAFAGEKPPKELKNIVKRVYQNLVQTFFEVLNLTKVNRKYVDRYVEVVNIKRIANAARSGNGTILLTGHFGNWELSSLVSSVEGFPIHVLVREQKMKRLNELLNRLRESNGCKVIRKGMSTKYILKSLYEKNIVGILSDQDAGRDGVFVDFFGRLTSCHSGPMEMARRTGSIILPNFIVRVKGPRHKLFLEDYIRPEDGVSDEDAVKTGLQKFASLLESYVRRYPDQWLWLHKRWKSTPTRTVLVLNDGKGGHLNQSLAVARQIQSSRTTQGYGVNDTKIVIVDVKFKNDFSKALLSICANFATWRCHGCMRCMKFCLERETYEKLMKTYSEFVVSCGSSLGSVNIFMSKENVAKNIVVMNPNLPFWRGKFSLAVIPAHDKPPRAANVVVTTLAPNLIDEEKLRTNGGALRKSLGLEKDRGVVGLLVGGDNPEFTITEEIIEKVAKGLLEFCERCNAKFVVTTSRRTPRAAEEALKAKLRNHQRCRLLVIANENNPKEAFGGILDLSKIVIVSGESVSMVSEAVASGKKVIVFKLKKKKGRMTKHELFLADLEKKGYIAISEPENLFASLEKAWSDTTQVSPPADTEIIFEAVRRII